MSGLECHYFVKHMSLCDKNRIQNIMLPIQDGFLKCFTVRFYEASD